jgi:hypothetical protein
MQGSIEFYSGKAVGGMYLEMYIIKQGNFKFMVEMDTGSEVGENQLSLWYSERVDINTIPLEQIDIHLLLKALKEPQRTLLLPSMEELKCIRKQQLEREINELLQPYQTTHIQPARKMPGDTKRQIKRLRKNIEQLIKQVEQTFIREELLTLERDCFNLELIAEESQIYGEWRFLRNFYFEEAEQQTIQNFCHEFASSEQYRLEVHQGEQHWIKRNQLFQRNLTTVLGERLWLAEDGSAMREAREFFRWLDIHLDTILTHPLYQHLQKIDSADRHDWQRPDIRLRVGIDIFTRLPGVSIKSSCQGVTGKIHFDNYQLLTVSHHEEYAYIAFNTMSYAVHDAIIATLPDYPSITTERIPCNFALNFVLRSTGDNPRFRREVLALAQRIQEKLAPIDQNKPTVKGWIETNYPASSVKTSEPGGMLSSRRFWLCQPGQIEHTLQLLYHLNHWAKASDLLFYADRQGLYTVKAVLLEEGYKQERIVPVGYVDGSKNFADDLMVDTAANIATETLFARLTETPPEEQDDEESKKARAIFQRITGCIYQTESDMEKISPEQAEEYICKALQGLIAQAQQTRQPIASEDLSNLCIYPTDILDIDYGRSRFISRWDDLGESDRRKLDPEGWSLVSLRYTSENAQYTFHLPYRIAATFLADEQLATLRANVTASREQGTYYGRALTEEESKRHPIEEILRELQIDIESVCPKHLERKTERQYYHHPVWCDYEDEEDEDEDEWEFDEDLYSLPKKKRGRKKKDAIKQTCPLCKTTIEEAQQARIEHWQQAHLEVDLTIRKVYWLLCTNEYAFKQLHITPDYRAEDQLNGTRYWKLGTLVKVVELLD